MTPRQLRLIIRRFGLLGAVFVAAYLGILSLWTKRRVETIAVGTMLLPVIGLLLLWPAHPHHRISVNGFPAVRKSSPLPAASPHPQLLGRAKRVVEASTWEPYFHDYFWLSDDEVLYCSQTNESPRYDVQVFRYNLNTHLRQSLPRLARLTYGLSTKHSLVCLSPDRLWFLWADRDSEQAIAVTIDGSIHETWPCHTFGAVGWLQDSRHWVEFAENRREQTVVGLRIRDTLKPLACKNIPIPPSTFHEGSPFVTGSNHYLVNTWPSDIGITARVAVYEGDLEKPAIAPRKYTISLPPKSEIDDIICSPSGERIAWLLTVGSAFATGEYAPEKAGPEVRTSIWVSNLDESNMHEVGSVTGSPDTPWYTLPHAVHWLPNGKSLSFLYRDSLWTVAAE